MTEKRTKTISYLGLGVGLSAHLQSRALGEGGARGEGGGGGDEEEGSGELHGGSMFFLSRRCYEKRRERKDEKGAWNLFREKEKNNIRQTPAVRLVKNVSSRNFFTEGDGKGQRGRKQRCRKQLLPTPDKTRNVCMFVLRLRNFYWKRYVLAEGNRTQIFSWTAISAISQLKNGLSRSSFVHKQGKL